MTSSPHPGMTGEQLDQLRTLIYEEMCKAIDESVRLTNEWRRACDEHGFRHHLEREAHEAELKSRGVSEGLHRALALLDSARRAAKTGQEASVR